MDSFLKGEFSVQLKNEISNPDELFEALTCFYKAKNREIKQLTSRYIGHGGVEGACFFVSFLLDRQYVIRYSISNARRTLHAIYLGVCSEYVPIQWLVPQNSEFKLSWDMTLEAVEINLGLLDVFLAEKAAF